MTAHSDDFHAALQVLVGTGAVKQRLVDAYRRHLASLREPDLPDASVTASPGCGQPCMKRPPPAA